MKQGNGQDNAKKNRQEPEKRRVSAHVRRDFRYGTNAIVLIAAVIVVFVILNVVLENFSGALTFDLTKEQLYSIGDVTRERMEALDQDVEIIALYDRVRGEADTSRVSVIRVLDLYAQFDRIHVSYVDPDANPGVIVNNVGTANASSYAEGDYIVKCGDKTRRIAESDMFLISLSDDDWFSLPIRSGMQVERRLTTAILYVTSDTSPVVYYVTGHEEESREAYSEIYAYLEALGCEIRELDFNATTEIPEDAAVLTFIDPKYDLSSREVTMMQQWAEQSGGQFVFCVDPHQNGLEYPNLNRFLQDLYGLRINNDQVQDEDAQLATSSNASEFYGFSVSNGPLANSNVYRTAIFNSRSVEVLSIDSESAHIEHYPLIQTGVTAFSVDILSQARTDRGVRAVAAASVNSSFVQVTRAAVFGSSLALSDEYLADDPKLAQTTQAIFAMSVDWMIESYGENAGSTIATKPYDTTRLTLTTGESNLIGILAIAVVPVVIIAIGIVLWLRRRHL